jgi:hypothetical protein
MKNLSIGSLAIAFALASTAHAEPATAVDKLVGNVITLRGEVDDLENEIRELKRERDSRMATLLRQEAELTAEKQRQTLRLKKLEQQIAGQKKSAASPELDQGDISDTLEASIAEASSYVQQSLPFKQADRLAALDQVREQLRAGSLEPARAANQLWTFVADELQLTGEVGLYRQPISVGGESKLVDVVRVGMMNLYFQTDDDRVGYWVPGAPEGSFRYAQGEEREHVRMLISSLRTNVRSGFFVLPNPQPALEGK